MQFSHEGLTNVLNTLMLVSALLLSFSVTLHVGTFSHSDLYEADARYQLQKMAQAGKNISFPDVLWGPVSNQLNIAGYLCEGFFLGALVVGASVSL